MATQIVCPRCKGSLPAAARACPRCGLVLTPRVAVANGNAPAEEMPPTAPAIPAAPSRSLAGKVAEPERPRNGTPERSVNGTGRSAATTEEAPAKRQPRTYGAGGQAYTPRASSHLVPRGALELLPGESVTYQLGALYLTTKRVILLSPSVIRSAFVRDIDAVGTFTDRASAWYLFFGVLLFLLAGGSVYAEVNRQSIEPALPLLFLIPPLVTAGILALLGLLVIMRYFLWSKRTLFVSVKGRPLITVSISDWSQRKLEGMDQFVNAFFQIKDLLTGELGEAQ